MPWEALLVQDFFRNVDFLGDGAALDFPHELQIAHLDAFAVFLIHPSPEAVGFFSRWADWEALARNELEMCVYWLAPQFVQGVLSDARIGFASLPVAVVAGQSSKTEKQATGFAMACFLEPVFLKPV